ncbi:MAG TPA: TlpA disulfide reductase family protein [Ignavibacteriaceae bacterium]|nr:TlpA disulfide reductase family protein [Ignavibacteriaceae bacterium]
MIKIVLIVICFSFFLTGCLKKNDEPVQKIQTERNNKLIAPHPYNVPELDSAKLSQLISIRYGRALFINVWATWCEPCIQEFPELVKTFNEYKTRNIDFVSLSVDQPEDDSIVVSTIKKFKAGFNVFIAAEKQSEKIINLLNSKWSGEVPATFIYDGNGKQEKIILGRRNFDFFKNSIDSVLFR